MTSQNIVSGAVGGIVGSILTSTVFLNNRNNSSETAVSLIRGEQGTTGPKGENGLHLHVVNSSGIELGSVPIYDTSITTAYTLKKIAGTNINKAADGSVTNVSGPLSAAVYGAGSNQLIFDATKVCGEIGTKPADGSTSVIIGKKSGTVFTNNKNIAIGNDAGNSGQSEGAIAIGFEAGYSGQSSFSVAIGAGAGYEYQKQTCVAVGPLAAETFQGVGCVAIGSGAGRTNQGGETGMAIAIGLNAGLSSQPCHSVCIGASAEHYVTDEIGPTAAHRAALSLRCRTNFDETGETGVAAFSTTADSLVAIDDSGDPVGTPNTTDVQSFYNAYIGGPATTSIGFLNCIFSNNDARYRALIPLVHVEKLP